jgi:outer membrane protein assembly factor BamB
MLSIQAGWTLVVAAGLGAAASMQAPPGSTSGWPGLWGPSRNAEAFAPSPAPTAFQEIWRRPSAGGYSEVAIAGDAVVSMELRDGSDFVVALDAATGRERWATRVAPTYNGHDGSNDGPIATPAIDRDQIFALGPNGHLVALQLPTGREQWRHDLVREFGATIPGWGFGASPLVATDRVIVPTGGEKSRGLLAFNRATGALAWSVPRGKNPGYSSAVLATIGGVSQVVAAAGDEVFAVAPDDGRLHWTITGPDPKDLTSNPPLLIPGDRVLYSTWNLSVMTKVTRNGEGFAATEIWRSPRVRAYNGPAIYRDGLLYTFTGPQLLCVDAATGNVKWQERVGAGTLMGMGANLALLGQTSGELRIVRASPAGYEELSRMRVFSPEVMSVTGPSFAAGRLFVRNVSEMAAFTVTPAR